MNIKKISIILLIIVLMLSILIIIPTTKTYASTIDDTFKGADNFINKGDTSVINTSELKDASEFIYNTLLAIAMVAAVIIGIILGIKYMVSDSESKASVKETLIPYMVSCCVIFGAFTIWKLVVNILK